MRLIGLDIARFLAFAGMVLVNFRIAAGVTPGLDPYSQLTNAMEGRAAALFVLLAGVGFSMGRSKRATVLARAAVLFAFGMANMILFDADILHYYALYFLVGLAFLNAPPRMLIIGAIALVLASLAGLILLDYDRGWNWETLVYQDYWTLSGFLRHSFYNGWHPVLPWAAFFLIGMWVGQQRLTETRTQLRLAATGLGLAVAATALSWSITDPELIEITALSPIPPGPLYMVAATGTALVVLSTILLLTTRARAPAPVQWMAQTGRQALTLYIAHIYIGMGTLETLGWLDGRLDPAAIFMISSGFILLSVVYALLWRRIASRGPAEALLRSISRRFVG